VSAQPSSVAKASEDNLRCAAEVGGADRDRTDDLKLAKLALSQLSYGPGFEKWTGAANRSCAYVVTTGLPSRSSRTHQPAFGYGAAASSRFASGGWWARDELNVRPHAYQACALTT
jgi:hypothetical protein